ncbi:MAG: redoxin domain-containing protein [Planctomycetota bacterium]
MKTSRRGPLSAIGVSLAAIGLAASSPLGFRARAAEPARTLEIGADAPGFDLPGVDGKRHRLEDFREAKVLVVVFTCNHCPTAQAYEERIAKLEADYREKGVALVAISPNDPEAVRLDELGYSDLGDSFEEMKIRAKERGFRFPYLYDGETQKFSRAYGALATPHVFVFDEARKLRYAGRFDDSEKKPPRSHDARNAVEALLAGKPVPVAKTRPFGCSVKWAEKREDVKRALERWAAEPVDLKPISAEEAKELAKNDTKKLRLVNLWATWCGPCVRELPEFVTMHRMYRGRDFELVTVSLDSIENREKALAALKKFQASTANYIYSGESKDALAEALDPEWPGPVPYTVLIAPGGKVIYRKDGAIDPLEVRREIVKYLGRTY